MEAAVLTEYGNMPEIAEIARPEFPDDSVMIEVHAAAINPVDWIIRDGYVKDMLPYELPWTPGYDVSGVVTEIGLDVGDFSTDDEVCLPGPMVCRPPANISHAQAASVPLAGLTARQALFDKGQLQYGQRVLIHAGSGGVSSLAIQFAKQAAPGWQRPPVPKTGHWSRSWVPIRLSTTRTNSSRTSSNPATSSSACSVATH